ncbi:hypothetical protein AVEN_197639-1 [Araneus ventricosus]|uniref:Uncharacterized protein n=1 Tax=Araneus ventricosus TaxID=182803 RepID=A0A4Y2JH09_ARAVE|nr:hypothetical protein AVEN_197639-1 [Araneus ventricosus]
MSNHTVFQDDWLSDPSFSSWLEKMPLNNKIAKCKLCVKTFDLSNMGRRAVSSHMNGIKHKKKVEASQKSASLFKKGASQNRSSLQLLIVRISRKRIRTMVN